MIFKLYNGEIELAFDEKKHKYTIDGKGIDGVSTTIKILAMSKVDDWAVSMDMTALKDLILKEQSLTPDLLDKLIKQASKQHAAERDGRADLGTNVHKAIEFFIKGQEIDFTLSPEESNRFNLFKLWADANVDHFVDSERPVYSKKHKYCGTLDFTCYLKRFKGLYVGDIKNAKYIYPKNFLQTAAYQAALQEEGGMVAEGRVIVRLGNDNVEIVKRDNFKQDFAMFIAALKLNRWFSKTQKELMKNLRRF